MHLACDEHEKLITDLRTQLEQEKKKHEETKSLLATLQTPANLQNISREILEKLDSLKLQISEEKDKCMGKEGKRKLLEEIKECREEIEDLKEQKFKDAREISTLLNSKEELNGVVENLREEIRGLEDTVDSKNAEIQELQVVVKNQKESLERVPDLEKELEEKKVKIEELTTQGVKDSEKIEVLEREKAECLRVIDGNAKNFKSRLAEKNQRIQDQQLIIEQSQRIIKTLEQELNELNAEMKQRENQAKNFANQQKKINQEVREFQKTMKLRDIEQLKQEVAILEKEVTQETLKQVQVGDSVNDMSAVLATKLQLEQMTTVVENQKASHLEELEKSSMELPKVNEMVDDLKKTVEDLRRENSRLVVSKNESVKSIEILKSENEDLRNELKTKEHVLEEQSEKIGLLMNNIAEEEKKIQDLQQTNTLFLLGKKFHDTVELEKRKLEEELKNKNRQIATLNQASKKHETNYYDSMSWVMDCKNEIMRSVRTRNQLASRIEYLGTENTRLHNEVLNMMKTQNPEKVESLEFELKKNTSENNWWSNYIVFESSVTFLFLVAQDMRTPENFYASQGIYDREKLRFERSSTYLKENPLYSWLNTTVGFEYFRKLEKIFKNRPDQCLMS